MEFIKNEQYLHECEKLLFSSESFLRKVTKNELLKFRDFIMAANDCIGVISYSKLTSF